MGRSGASLIPSYAHICRAERALGGGRRKMLRSILQGRALTHVHQAVMRPVPSAACGQSRLRTGRKQSHKRPQPEKENQQDAQKPPHSAPILTGNQCDWPFKNTAGFHHGYHTSIERDLLNGKQLVAIIWRRARCILGTEARSGFRYQSLKRYGRSLSQSGIGFNECHLRRGAFPELSILEVRSRLLVETKSILVT